RAGVTAEADLLAGAIRPSLSVAAHRFLAQQRFAVAASLDSEGAVWASPLSGPPGFLQPVDEELLRIEALHTDPLLLDNLRGQAPLGLLVIDFATRRRMRLNGRALVDGDAIFLHLAEAYPNCPKYIRPRHLLVREPGRDDLPGPPLRSSSLSPSQRGWIRRADTFFIASFHP